MWVMISLCWKTAHEMLCVCYSWHVPTAIWGWAQITKINVQIHHWQIHKHTHISEKYMPQSSGGVYPMINYMIIRNTHQFRLQIAFVTVFALFTFLVAFCGAPLKKCSPSTQSDARVNMDSCVCWSNTSFQPHCPALRCYLLADKRSSLYVTANTSHKPPDASPVTNCLHYIPFHSLRIGCVQQTAAGVCIVGYGTGYWSWLGWRNKFI